MCAEQPGKGRISDKEGEMKITAEQLKKDYAKRKKQQSTDYWQYVWDRNSSYLHERRVYR